jgi:hypothetical protein
LMFLYLKSAIIYRAIFKAVFFSILLEWCYHKTLNKFGKLTLCDPMYFVVPRPSNKIPNIPGCIILYLDANTPLGVAMLRRWIMDCGKVIGWLHLEWKSYLLVCDTEN